MRDTITNHSPRHQHSDQGRPRDSGFTLVELLIVIVILGILATVTVFAVRGITDTGQENSESSDLKTLETAAEAYYILNDGTTAASQAALVTAGLLKDESTLHQLTVAGDGSYTITNTRTGNVVGNGSAPGSGGATTTLAPEAPNVTQSHTIATYSALRYGTGSKTLVFLDNGDPQTLAEYNSWVSSNPQIADTQFIFVTDPSARNTAAIEDILAVGATAWIAPYDFAFQWTVSTGGQQVPQWWLSPDSYTFGPTRVSTGVAPSGLGNVIQWSPGGSPLFSGVTVFEANY